MQSKKIFFYLPEGIGISITDNSTYIGSQPPIDIINYDYFCIFSSSMLPSKLIEKIKKKPFIIFGDGEVPEISNNRSVNAITNQGDKTNIFDRSLNLFSRGDIELEEYQPVAKEIKITKEKSDNFDSDDIMRFFNDIYQFGYRYSCKKIKQKVKVIVNDIQNYPLVWEYKNIKWVSSPSNFLKQLKYNNLTIFNKIIDYFFEKESEPEWAENTKFEWERNINLEIKDLTNSINEKKKQLEIYHQIRSILWKKHAALEDAIKLLFNDLDIKNDKKYNLDNFIYHNDRAILIEIKGYDKNVDKTRYDEIHSQVKTNYKKFSLQEKKQSKFLIIINHERRIEPNKRNPLTKYYVELLYSELDFDCCIISSKELLNFYKLIKNNKLDKDTFLSHILTSKKEIKANDVLSTHKYKVSI